MALLRFATLKRKIVPFCHTQRDCNEEIWNSIKNREAFTLRLTRSTLLFKLRVYSSRTFNETVHPKASLPVSLFTDSL